MNHWSIEPLILELKFTWAISRNSSTSKTNYLVKYSRDGITGIGEVAPNIRYGEDAELIRSQWQQMKKILPSGIPDLEEVSALLNTITLCNALRCGLECALIHWISQKSLISVCNLLAIPEPAPVDTLFSIPIMDAKDVAIFMNEMNLQRFRMLKVKISVNQTPDFLNEILAHSHTPLLLDANESWSTASEFEKFLKKLPGDRILYIEQPFKSHLTNEYKRLKSFTSIPIIADESCLRNSHIHDLNHYFGGINIKLMKTGGPIKAVEHLKEANKLGMKTMIGCMIESPIGIWWGYMLNSLAQIHDLDSFLMLKKINHQPMKEANGTLFSPHNGTSSF